MDADDDDMADLFSFSAEVPASSEFTAPSSQSGDDVAPVRERLRSDDSLLEMLANESSTSVTGNTTVNSNLDKETQDILSWLDEDENQSQYPDSVLKTSSLKEAEPTGETSKSPAQIKGFETANHPEAATVVVLPPAFASLQEALVSKESTPKQIRELYRKQEKPELIDKNIRPELYCRMLCSKSLEDTLATSLADSFEKWELPDKSKQPAWILDLAIKWASVVSKESGRALDECSLDMTKLLMYYFKDTVLAAKLNGGKSDEKSESGNAKKDFEFQTSESVNDPLVPAAVSILLSTGMPAPAASVTLSKILANHLPLLALKPDERWEAALLLHTDFYALATYHLPLLVFHLDRYMPGWYWPSLESLSCQSEESTTEAQSATVISRNLQQQGKLPASWFLTMWAGASSSQNDGINSFPIDTVLGIWDKTFLSESKDIHFFLSLALLQDISDDLLLLEDEALVKAFQRFVSSASYLESDIKDLRYDVSQWWAQAQSLQSRTPASVISTLTVSVDKALQQALDLRRERAETALEARLQAEAEAHQKAHDAKTNAARDRLNRARLVAFYRVHAPDKECNIDQIIKTYEGRLDVLNSKMQLKYGEGFNPAISSSVSPTKTSSTIKNASSQGTSKLFAAMNRGLGRKDSIGRSEEAGITQVDRVTVTTSPSEVLPIVCWSKEASSSHGSVRRRGVGSGRKSLKYYIVDARSDEASTEEGRFPTAVSLSPEALLDPERIKTNEEMFESLRGAVHIVIMGEGFSALPALYSQKNSQNLIDLVNGDESRTNLCALFFIKKGFPFVSILEGGFAAAHSWLVRLGPTHHLSASSVLVDYDPDSSLFGQMEKMHNETASEKAQRVMGNLLENSMVAMTKRAQQLESIAADMEKNERTFRMPQIFRVGGQRDRLLDGPGDDANRITFMNPFAGRSKAPNHSDELADKSKQSSDEGGSINKHENQSPATPASSKPPSDTKEVQMPNLFKGLAAAANSTSQRSTTESRTNQGVPTILKRNPFARFGGQPQGTQAQVSGQQTFARMNQFRKSTMARIRVPGGREDCEEESITFGSAISESTVPDVQQV